MRSIDNIMGEIRTEAAEMGLVEKLEERERARVRADQRELANLRAFVRELVDCLPATDDLEHVAATMSGVRGHYEHVRASEGAMEGIARIERCIDALLAIQIATERPSGQRALALLGDAGTGGGGR